MLKKNIKSLLSVILVLVAFIVTAAAVLTGSYVRDKVNITVGMVSPERFTSPRDYEDEAATQKLREQASASVGTLYKHDNDVQSDAVNNLTDFFDSMNKIIDGSSSGVVLKIPVVLNDKQYKTYGELTESGKEQFRNDIIDITNYTFDQGITAESMTKALEIADSRLSQTQWNSDLKAIGRIVLNAVLEPNIVPDTDAMEVAKNQKIEEVQPVIIKQGQKIVDEGEIITEDIYNKLQELNLINQDYGDNLVPIIGSLLTIILLFLAIGMFFWRIGRSSVISAKNSLMIFTIYILEILIFRVTANMDMYCFIPSSLFAMLVSILIEPKLAIVLNFFVLATCNFIFNGSIGALMYFVITGAFASMLIHHTRNRSNILPVSFAYGLICIASYVAVGLFFEGGYSKALIKGGGFAALTGFMTVIIVIGSLPFWEGVFDVNTSIKLLELAKPDAAIIRRLMIEAPGTYHHSLIVANLAETAAYELNADSALCRVGAYYHDIGKLKYPSYFSENQYGVNPHDRLDPHNSAKIIKEHTRYGIELAETNNLPKAVKDIIVQHHGTTLIKYFYYQACKTKPEGTVDEADFRYEGPIPQSKEALIVMIADTVEAAARATISKGNSLVDVDNLIKSLIKDKLDDGQFNDSDISMKDLNVIRKAFLKVFQGMYHDRISYPDMKEINEARKKEALAKEDKEKNKDTAIEQNEEEDNEKTD